MIVFIASILASFFNPQRCDALLICGTIFISAHYMSIKRANNKDEEKHGNEEKEE